MRIWRNPALRRGFSISERGGSMVSSTYIWQSPVIVPPRARPCPTCFILLFSLPYSFRLLGEHCSYSVLRVLTRKVFALLYFLRYSAPVRTEDRGPSERAEDLPRDERYAHAYVSGTGRMSPSPSVLQETVGPFRVSYTKTPNYGNHQSKETRGNCEGC